MSDPDTSAIEAAVRRLVVGEVDFQRGSLSHNGQSWATLISTWSHPDTISRTHVEYIDNLLKWEAEFAAEEIVRSFGLPQKFRKG